MAISRQNGLQTSEQTSFGVWSRVRWCNWNSFSDRNLAGWDEADNSNAFRVTEFNPLRGETLVIGSTAIELGTLVDATGQGLDIVEFLFEFSLTTGESLLGVVELGMLPIGSLRGDYDKNGVVSAGDFDTWKSAFGQTVAPGNGADGNRDGVWMRRTTLYGVKALPPRAR
jgi:hypothetical protein